MRPTHVLLTLAAAFIAAATQDTVGLAIASLTLAGTLLCVALESR